MKKELIELLFEEYKQICLFDDLEEKGISMGDITVRNWDIVLSLIGFPKDNSIEYDWGHINGLPHDPSRGKKSDDKLFVRDWLYDPYYEIISKTEKVQTFTVTDKGLKMNEKEDEIRIKRSFSEYIDWLYLEYEKINNK